MNIYETRDYIIKDVEELANKIKALRNTGTDIKDIVYLGGYYMSIYSVLSPEATNKLCNNIMNTIYRLHDELIQFNTEYEIGIAAFKNSPYYDVIYKINFKEYGEAIRLLSMK